VPGAMPEVVSTRFVLLAGVLHARDGSGLVFKRRDARIVRQVPFSPLSRDADSYRRLTRSLAIYRMVFGQARQEDLIAYLLSKAGSGAGAEPVITTAPINLEPPAISLATQADRSTASK
jgi:hypothetical protein